MSKVRRWMLCRCVYSLTVDQDWVDAVNAERQKEQMGKVSYETFEVIMDRLEKEWFGLVRLSHSRAPSCRHADFLQTKNISQPDMALPSEDSTCAICDDSEGENMNAIVFCDGCNLAVHQGGPMSLILPL